jgi:hypothetical protein
VVVVNVVVPNVFLLFDGRGGDISRARLDGRPIATRVDPTG